MAIFSFRPTSQSRRRALDVPADWAETRPAEFAEAEMADVPFVPSTFVADPAPVGGNSRLDIANGAALERRPDPGFAKNLTARAQSDELLGAGWYISSWDLMQGLDVIEGTPIDLLPPEWQRKRPRV